MKGVGSFREGEAPSEPNAIHRTVHPCFSAVSFPFANRGPERIGPVLFAVFAPLRETL
jgi:hypothetical protein